MSISSEISRISGNVSDSLAAVAAKGVTVPTGSNSDDLAGLIAQISSGGTGAISIVDTADSGGGTVRTITAVDISDTTAAAADVASGKFFYTADGTKTEGTGSGGGGLTYETGTWTPASDVYDHTISFANTHTVAPFYFMIWDNTGTNLTTTSTAYAVVYSNASQFFGNGYTTGNTTQYGFAVRRYRNASNATTGTTGVLNTPYTDNTTSANNNSRYWATETGIRAYYGSNGYYWRSGRTYKWLAVWAPTT